MCSSLSLNAGVLGLLLWMFWGVRVWFCMFFAKLGNIEDDRAVMKDFGFI